MQVFVTCPDWGLPAVTVTAGADSVVSDVLTTAAGEWDVDPDEVELSFAGDTLCETDRLADHGVEFEMWEKQFRIFGKSWFVDNAKREQLLLWMRDHITEYLCLDTPTFTEDGCLTVDGKLLPSDAKQVAFRNSNSNSTAMSSVTTIGDEFLFCSQITSLDLSGFSSVTTIGDDFLSFCSGITSLDLSSLNSVTTIGYLFLSNCRRLTSLNFSAPSNVTTIGCFFMSSCSGITSLDLSGLSSVTTIGNNFLTSCSRLTSVNFSGRSSVTTIGDCFLLSCSKITTLDLSSLSSVTGIGLNFLRKCDSLESVQLPESNSALFEKSVKAVIDHSG